MFVKQGRHCLVFLAAADNILLILERKNWKNKQNLFLILGNFFS